MTRDVRATRRWRPLRLLVLLAVGLLGLAGCGSQAITATSSASGSSSKNAKLHIALFGYGANNTYTEEVYHAVAADAAKVGGTTTFFDGQFSGPIQSTQMTDATTSGKFNAYLLLPNDVAGIVPAVKDAIAHHIKVIALHFQIGGKYVETPQVPGLVTCICASYTAGAQAIAQEVVKACANIDPCTDVNFYGNKSQSWEVPRRTTFNAVIAKHPNIKIIAEPNAGFDTGMAYQAMQAILAGHPRINVVSSPSADQMISGAQKALQDAGYRIGSPGGVALIGNSSDYQGVAGVRSGKWLATYINCPQSCEAKYGVLEAMRAIHGQSVPPVIYEDAAPNAIWGPKDGCGGAVVDKAFLARCPWFKGEYEG